MRILFVGNSFTSRNGLPGLLTALAGARGRNVEHRLISAGGASLRQHLNAGTALAAIAEQSYDVVVLQEQSTLPAKNAARMHDSVRDFHAAIDQAGAQTALYLTWARRNEPEKQRAITTAYASIAAEVGATLVPVGVVWERFLRTHDQPALHAPTTAIRHWPAATSPRASSSSPYSAKTQSASTYQSRASTPKPPP
ncbi:hypothetical protein [Kribbella deserti]|uniref:SGNH/GDSL hydrolase family protein n=1 Tax=Kribbella deserti TaxID=1926257 RepID=A0ABV6QHN2_9ACTN